MDVTGCDCLSLDDQRLVNDAHSGDLVCTTCACVVESHHMEQGPEWFDDSLARAAPTGKLDAFLGSTNGAVFTHKKRLMEPDVQKNVRAGLKRVEHMVGLMGFQSDHLTCSSSQGLFKDYWEARKAQGRTVKESERDVAAACAVYFGCKSQERDMHRHSRSIKEICMMCGQSVQEMTEMSKSFRACLSDKPYAKLLFNTVTAEDLLLRAVDGITFHTDADAVKVINKAREVFKMIKDQDLLEGRTPETVCSAVLFKACDALGLRIPKKSIYQACGVSNVTLNKALQDLKHI